MDTSEDTRQRIAAASVAKHAGTIPVTEEVLAGAVSYPPDAEELEGRRRARRRRPDADPAPWQTGTRPPLASELGVTIDAHSRVRPIAPTGRTGGKPKRRGRR